MQEPAKNIDRAYRLKEEIMSQSLASRERDCFSYVARFTQLTLINININRSDVLQVHWRSPHERFKKFRPQLHALQIHQDWAILQSNVRSPDMLMLILCLMSLLISQINVKQNCR